MVEIVRNPCQSDHDAMRRESIKKYGPPTSHDTRLRLKEDDDGNVYYWASGDGIHAVIDPLLMARIK